MTLDEFRKQLGADPESREPETRSARGAGPEFDRAEQEALDFERRLKSTLLAPSNEALTESLLQIPDRVPAASRPRWLAVAASALIAAGALTVIWTQTRPPADIEAYVVQHLAEDGASVMRHADGVVTEAQIDRVLAALGVSAGDALAQHLRLVKFCPTPDGRGAHMVVDTGAGAVHLIYMPGTRVIDGRSFTTGAMKAQLVALPAGSAVIVGAPDQPLDQVDRWVREGIAARPAAA